MQHLLPVVSEAWGWTGCKPVEVIAMNAFGNLILRDDEGCFWRLCPEDVYCRIVAKSSADYGVLVGSEDFLSDWEMIDLVKAAREKLGTPGSGRCYCLKLPGVLGGEYGCDNVATVSVEELIASSGDIGRQIKDLPDGTQIDLVMD